MKFNNIALIGFMGSGKSTIGRILSKKLGLLFIDIDKVIQLSEGKSIGEIFRSSGEEYFRKIETRVIKKIFLNKNCVFACGGGVVKSKENINVIRKNSIIVYLYISSEEAYIRLKEVKDRPLLEVKDRQGAIKKMIEDREILYRKSADVTVDNTKKKPEIVASEIISKLYN